MENASNENRLPVNVNPPLRYDVAELLHRDHYSVEEAAYLLGMDPEVLNQAAHRHELAAIFADHHVMHLRRDDLVRWLESR